MITSNAEPFLTANPYLDPLRIQAALNGLGLRPNKALGQNFLLDADALGAALAAAELSEADTVLEIGPGLGVLTYELVRRAGRVIAIEFDARLATRLPEALRAANLEVVQADVLQVVPGEIISGPYKIVANLPYHITSAIMRHFLEAAQPPERMVVMVQREVAERIVAGPPDLSVLAHSVQFYARAEIVARVPAAAFLPAPKVDSALLCLQRRATPLVAVDDVHALFRVIKAGFSQARKKLANALPTGLHASGISLSKEQTLTLLTGVGVDPNRRAETLTLHEWAAVYTALQQKHGNALAPSVDQDEQEAQPAPTDF